MKATCLHCRGKCRLTNGREVYPHRPDLYGKSIWKCDPCGATVGCHPGGQKPLGYAANKATRRARMLLHNRRLDPLWKKAPKGQRQYMRGAVYQYLGHGMGLTPDKTHTGMFTIEQCREAWRCLEGQTPESIRDWHYHKEDSTNGQREPARGGGTIGEHDRQPSQHDDPSRPHPCSGAS